MELQEPAFDSIGPVYLNGRFVPLSEARVSVLDRGFIFGDGVYEVIPAYARRPFRLEAHLDRLQASLDGIRLANPHSKEEWVRLVNELIARSRGEDLSVYLHVTRGPALRDHAFPPVVYPTVFMMCSPLTPPPRDQVENGVACVTLADNRWLRCNIKSISLLPNVLLRQAALDAGAVEAVLLRDGFLTEGSASNIFVVHGGKLLAPPKSHLMLPGITYDVVLELAAAAGIPFEVRPVTEDEVRHAEELWITSSTREVLACTRLDGKPLGAGKPGPLFHRVYALYQDYKAELKRG